jgi:hypothetical protein
VPLSDAGRSSLMSLLNHGSSEQHHASLKGAPLDKDTVSVD